MTNERDHTVISSLPCRSLRSKFIICLTALMAAIGSGLSNPPVAIASVSVAEQPTHVVQATVDQALALLKDKSMAKADRRRQLIRLVQGHFDFAAMARSALGPHWKNLSGDQRRSFVTLFIAFLEDAYIGKLESYSGQPIQFAKEIQRAPDEVEVDTNVLQQQGPPVQINYLMKGKNGGWKVYDVTVDSISIIANYRNQFNRVITEHGFPELMSRMEQKRKELDVSL